MVEPCQLPLTARSALARNIKVIEDTLKFSEHQTLLKSELYNSRYGEKTKANEIGKQNPNLQHKT